MTTKKLMTPILGAALGLAAACGGMQTSTETAAELPNELERAAQTRWDVSLTEDRGLMVRPREPTMEAPRERSQWPEQGDDLLIAVEEAAESQLIEPGKEGFPDIRVSHDQPGVVKLDGQVQSEIEAVNAIDAALGVEGVDAVISYLEWPGAEDDIAQLQLTP